MTPDTLEPARPLALPGIHAQPLDATGRPADQPRPPLRWWQNWALRFGAFLLVMVPASILGAMLVDRAGLAQHDWPYALVQIAATVLAYLAVLLVENRRRPVELRASRLVDVVTGLGIGTLAMVVVFALAVALGAREVRGFNTDYRDWETVLMVGLAAGIAEEIMFRGILYRLVEGWLGTWVSLLVSAAVFGGVHLGNPQASMMGAVAIALEAGLMFGLLYAVTRSLWIVMGVHAAWNVVQGPVLGSAISGATKDGEGLVDSYAKGPELLSGGAFGLEASIIAIAVWLCFSAVLVRVLVREGLVVPPSWVRKGRAAELAAASTPDEAALTPPTR